MREIIFRGKRIDNGEWVYGSLFIQNGEWISKGNKTPDVYWIYGKQGEQYLVITSTICQFTGLTDKDNKKIYEGDIVRTKLGRLCKVRYFVSSAFCGVDLFPLNTKHRPPTDYDIYQKDFLEVVGNIFDNPNPLEVE